MESNTDYINEQQGKCRVTRRIENLLVQIKLQIYNETRLIFISIIWTKSLIESIINFSLLIDFRNKESKKKYKFPFNF